MRFVAMAALVMAKALIGHEEIHPYELVFEVVEVLGVFAAGVHAAGYLHRHGHGKEN